MANAQAAEKFGNKAADSTQSDDRDAAPLEPQLPDTSKQSHLPIEYVAARTRLLARRRRNVREAIPDDYQFIKREPSSVPDPHVGLSGSMADHQSADRHSS